MTDSNTTTTATPAADKNAKTVAESMPSRRVFETVDEAIAYLTNCGETYSDFGAIPMAAPGVDSEGNFDPAQFNNDTEVMVAKLRRVGTSDQRDKGLKPGISAIVIGAVPKLQALLADEAGLAWVQGIIHKELNHVLVRPLRDAANVATVVDEMPTTLAGFITSGREASSGIMESFNVTYKSINDFLSAKVPVWKRARLIKSEFKACLESSAYALEVWPALEDRGPNKDSLFVMALGLFIMRAKRDGLDTAIFDRWLATRDQQAFDPAVEDEDDFDLESLSESMLEATEEPAGDDTTDEAEQPAE